MSQDNLQETNDVERSDANEPAHRLTWDQCAIVVFLTTAVSVLLSIALASVYLAPSNLFFTPVLRCALVFVWLPVLIICALRRPSGRIVVPILLLLVGIIASMFFALPFVGSSIALSFGTGGRESGRRSG